MWWVMTWQGGGGLMPPYGPERWPLWTTPNYRIQVLPRAQTPQFQWSHPRTPPLLGISEYLGSEILRHDSINLHVKKIALIYKRLCWLSNQICAPDIRLASGTISANVDTASKSKEAILDKERECSLWSRKVSFSVALVGAWVGRSSVGTIFKFGRSVILPSRPSRGRTDYKGLFCHHSTWSQKRDNKLCFVNPHFSIFNFENLSHNW